MNYQKIYNQIIAKRQQQQLFKNSNNIGAIESHHIIPKCVGGLDQPNNIVNLTPREHYICHLLLWKIYPKSIGLTFALMSMTNNNNSTNQRKFKYSSKLYEKAKIAFAQRMKEYYAEHDGPIKGKHLVFNVNTQHIEYFDLSQLCSSNIIKLKVMWICNDSTNEEKCIPDFQDIPEGWRKGRRKTIKTSHTGLIMISNPTTLEVRYISKNTLIPDGWKRGKSRPINLKRHKEYFNKQKECYKQKAKQLFDYFIKNDLSFVKLSAKFPEIKKYMASKYVMQLFRRYLPNFKEATQQIKQLKLKLKAVGKKPFEGQWDNSTKHDTKNNGRLHKIKQAVIGTVKLD